MKIETPHINSYTEDFAKTVLMPGDPLRSKFIAENFLKDAKLINSVRSINGYTGYYKDKRVTVMASGMGIPSMGIYSYELFNFCGVEKIIRIGSAGAISDKLELRDVVAAMGVCSNSNYCKQFNLQGDLSPIADFNLLCDAKKAGEDIGVDVRVGNFLSTDVFYDDLAELKKWQEFGVLAVEMESVSLYTNALKAGKSAITLCTISDKPLIGEKCSAMEREKDFTKMMKIALEIA